MNQSETHRPHEGSAHVTDGDIHSRNGRDYFVAFLPYADRVTDLGYESRETRSGRGTIEEFYPTLTEATERFRALIRGRIVERCELRMRHGQCLQFTLVCDWNDSEGEPL